jgi:hypothetical protein
LPDLHPYGVYLLPDGRRYIAVPADSCYYLHVERRGVGSMPAYKVGSDGWVSDPSSRERVYSAENLLDTGEIYDGG